MTVLPSMMLMLLVVLAATTSAQNPPGVPPRQHQPPVQNQQQFNQQQMNVQEGHGHGAHGGNKLKFQTEIHNADHIIEHLQNVIKTKPKEQMSEEELEFHYFKMHDYDNNNKLDGVEIGKALTHFHDEVDEAASDHEKAAAPGEEAPKPRVFSDQEISNIVDVVINDNDENGDGYVEYFEFKRKQQQQQKQQQGDEQK